MKHTRKFMSLVLALLLTLAFFPMSALAAESYGDRVRASGKVFDASNGDNKTPYNLQWEDGAKGIISFDVQVAEIPYMGAQIAYRIFIEHNGILSNASISVGRNVGTSMHATADISNFIVAPGDYVFYVVAGYMEYTSDFYSEVAKSPVYTHGGSQSAITVPIAAGSTFTPGEFSLTAIKSDNTMWNHEFLGNDGYGKSTKLNDGVIAVATGGSHELFIKSDNSLWGWGNNSEGQLGDGTTTQRPYMEPVKIMDSVAYVHAGEYTTGNSSFAIKTDGSLWAWGDNANYQLGDGTNIDRLTPVKVMDGVSSVSHVNNRVLAVKQDGTLWGWGGVSSSGGGNTGLLLGNGITPTMQMEGVIFATQTEGGSLFFIKPDNSLWARSGSDSAVQVTDSVKDFAYSYDEGAAFIKTDGSLWTWNGLYSAPNPADFSKVMDGVVDIRSDNGQIWALQSDGTLLRQQDGVFDWKVFEGVKIPVR